jgi:hypothetical protein
MAIIGETGNGGPHDADGVLAGRPLVEIEACRRWCPAMNSGPLHEADLVGRHQEAIDIDVEGVADGHVHFDEGLHQDGVAREREHRFDGFRQRYRLTTTTEGKAEGDHRNGEGAESDVDQAIGHGVGGYRTTADYRQSRSSAHFVIPGA